MLNLMRMPQTHGATRADRDRLVCQSPDAELQHGQSGVVDEGAGWVVQPEQLV
jgi:hypothetical protein